MIIGTGTCTVNYSQAGSDNYNPATASETVTAYIEDANITFDGTNPATLQVSSPGGSLDSGALSLRVDVQETSPDLAAGTAQPGDISNAGPLTVTLTPLSGGSPISLDCSYSEVSGSDYSAVKTFTCTNSTILAVDTYDVEATSSGNFYASRPGYDGFTVYDPSLGFATGGGWFYWPGTTDKTNFGFTMKYNNKGNSVKGTLLVIRHYAGGTIARIKSNALEGLALQDSGGYGIATFSGKSTYMIWDPDLSEYVNKGGIPFAVYAKDANDPGTNPDYFWIRSGPNLTMSNPAASNAVVPLGGNIAIPRK